MDVIIRLRYQNILKIKKQEKDIELIDIIFENDKYSSISQEKNYDYSIIENIFSFSLRDMLEVYSKSTLTNSNILINNNNSNILKSNENILKDLQKLSKSSKCKIYNISWTFYGCISLISLPDISKWNTSNVTNMKDMFVGCKQSLNIPSKFK